MGGFVQTVRAALLDHYFGKATLTAPAALHVGLSSTTPTSAGANFTEPSAGGYVRVETAPTDWNASTEADPCVLDNLNAVTFPKATATWLAGADLTHAGLFVASTGGTPVAWGALAVAKPILIDDTATYDAGDLDITLAGA